MIKTIITSNTITDTAKNIQRSYLVLKLISVGWKVFSIALNLHSYYLKISQLLISSMIFICFLFPSLLGWQLSWHRRSREEKRELLNYIDTHQVPIKAIDPKICVLRNINYDGVIVDDRSRIKPKVRPNVHSVFAKYSAE